MQTKWDNQTYRLSDTRQLEPCQVCKGTGRLWVLAASHKSEQVCSSCQGSGVWEMTSEAKGCSGVMLAVLATGLLALAYVYGMLWAALVVIIVAFLLYELWQPE